MNGTKETKGLIKQLDEELQKPISSKSNLTVSELQNLQHSIDANIQNLNSKNQELANASQQVSFKQLYEAVISVQKSGLEQCPACHTPLSQVTVNPYEHAETELIGLNHLSELQEATKKLDIDINAALQRLSHIINICCSHFTINNIILPLQTSDDSVNHNWWSFIHEELYGGLTGWQYIKDQVKDLENLDKQIDYISEKRGEKQLELKRLRQFRDKTLKLKTQREGILNTKKKAEETIEKFDVENAQLILEVKAEEIDVAKNKEIVNAYSTFVLKLNEYNDSLPVKLIEDLGETVVSLYNAFNRNDGIHYQLADIKLPIKQNQRMEITFANNPDNYFDALHVLSEGHIRCLGLAILTAKNIKEGCPFFIFDDPVNAIDDDHRESIRKTIYEDTYFQDKQIILTCHGEEFFKDIQNQLPVKQAKAVKTISFLPNNTGYNISVDHNCLPRNYIVAAQNHIEKNEIRDALDKSRKALETLTCDKLWPYLNKNGGDSLSIRLRSATEPIPLRTLTEQLKSRIGNNKISAPNKDSVLDALELILGINGNSKEWRYLNKGTHEEANRTEFDRQTVIGIVMALEQIDEAVDASK